MHWDPPFKMSANFHNFAPARPPPPLSAVFYYYPSANLTNFLSLPPKKCWRLKWMVPIHNNTYICNNYITIWYKGVLSLVQIQLDGSDMAWTSKVLVLFIIATAMAEKLSLPSVEFLKAFAIKYQRESIVMNLPKEFSHNQVLKRWESKNHQLEFQSRIDKFSQ